MAISKREHQELRKILLRDGTVRPSGLAGERKAHSKEQSKQNAIEARRRDLQLARNASSQSS